MVKAPPGGVPRFTPPYITPRRRRDEPAPRQVSDLLAVSFALEAARQAMVAANQKNAAEIEADPFVWLAALFPDYTRHPPARRHRELWAWIWDIEPDHRPPPYVAIWPRMGAKSTTAELSSVALGARTVNGRLIRPYHLYVCETQDQADDHVANIARMLETAAIGAYYPRMGERLVGKYGNSQGWRRNRVRTASGYTVDAIGLDTASRGVKLDADRPGYIIFDDIDRQSDSANATAKKIKTITTSIIPAGAADVAFLFVQNKILDSGVFAQLADGRAKFLGDRQVSGPHKAIEDLAFDEVYDPQTKTTTWPITAGRATWQGFDLPTAQAALNDMGPTAFLAEMQHETPEEEGGLFGATTFRHCAPEEVPELVQIAVWCDPAVTSSDGSDSQAIAVMGVAEDGRLYLLWCMERVTTPELVLQWAILKAIEYGADRVGVETNQGGDLWEITYYSVADRIYKEYGLSAPRFVQAKAGSDMSKVHRVSTMLVDYERGRVIHVTGPHTTAEKALRRFPIKKPYDLTDAIYWGWFDLTVGVENSQDGQKRLALPGLSGMQRGQ